MVLLTIPLMRSARGVKKILSVKMLFWVQEPCKHGKRSFLHFGKFISKIMKFIESPYHSLWLTSTYSKEFQEAISRSIRLTYFSCLCHREQLCNVGHNAIRGLRFLIYKMKIIMPKDRYRDQIICHEILWKTSTKYKDIHFDILIHTTCCRWLRNHNLSSKSKFFHSKVNNLHRERTLQWATVEYLPFKRRYRVR